MFWWNHQSQPVLWSRSRTFLPGAGEKTLAPGSCSETWVFSDGKVATNLKIVDKLKIFLTPIKRTITSTGYSLKKEKLFYFIFQNSIFWLNLF